MSQAHVLTSPSISLVNDRPATTSLAIAESFGKRHDHVVRSIQDLIHKLPESFSAPNFGAAEYMDEQGKPRPMFTVFFDGFILLVMGYTGKKALQMKLAYIAAFNAMKEKLDKQAAEELAALSGDVKQIPEGLSTAASRAPLRSLVHAWAQVSGIPHNALWPQVRAHFQLSRIDDLPESWLPDALAFVQEKIDLCVKGLPQGQGPELPGNGFPPSSPAAPGLQPDFPADMDNGRKDALKKIQRLTWGVHAALDVVKLFCNPRYIPGPGGDVPLDIALNLFKSAQSNLVAAYNDLEAGYRLGKFFERG
ncbi:MAG: Rha family transcriptional regulator [Desulfovibrio sp.]|nr:Rha family transcriptional regulator [Desulfovibrio sp.]